MLVNNESGRIIDLEPIADLKDRCAAAGTIATDAVQAINWLDVAVAAERADMMSLSAISLER